MLCPTCHGAGEVQPICTVCGERHDPYVFDYRLHEQKLWEAKDETFATVPSTESGKPPEGLGEPTSEDLIVCGELPKG
jgi:hypothetical protein